MTKEEALNILAVSEGASAEELNRKFGELQNDYQMRLTNAPTPNLKKLYQKNLSELNEAKSLLLGVSSEKVSDLPSVEPSFKKPDPSTQNFRVEEKEASTNHKKQTIKDENNESGNKWQMISIALGIVVLAVVIFALVDINRRSGEFDIQNGEFEELKTLYEETNSKLDKYDNVFENGNFKVKNNGTQSFTVEWIIVNYLDESGDIQKYFEVTNKSIRPGSSTAFSKVEGANTVWDGSVVFFVCSIKNGAMQTFQSGVWSNESENGVLNWNWDK